MTPQDYDRLIERIAKILALQHSHIRTMEAIVRRKVWEAMGSQERGELGYKAVEQKQVREHLASDRVFMEAILRGKILLTPEELNQWMERQFPDENNEPPGPQNA